MAGSHRAGGVGSPLDPLREPNFRWYAAARLVNLLGGGMYPVALAFAVLEVDDRPSALGLALASQTLPMVLLLLFGGVVADRLGRARVLRTSYAVAGVSQTALVLLVLTDRATLGVFVGFSVVLGVCFGLSFPAMSSMLPQLVPREQLQQANVLMSMIRGVSMVAGPSAAGVLVVTVGPGWALAVDAATWLLSAALLLLVRVAPAEREQSAGVLADLREGWDYVRSTTWLWVVVLGFAFLNAVHAGAWYTLGPARAKETFGETGWGFALSAEAVGLLAMTVVMSRVRLERPLLLGLLSIALFAVPLLVLGLAPSIAVLVVAALLAGAGMEVFNLGWNLAMQEHVEERMLSRAYSYDALGSFVALPIGQLAFGLLGSAFDPGPVVAVAGACYAVVALAMLLSGSVRGLRRADVAEPVADGGH